MLLLLLFLFYVKINCVGSEIEIIYLRLFLSGPRTGIFRPSVIFHLNFWHRKTIILYIFFLQARFIIIIYLVTSCFVTYGGYFFRFLFLLFLIPYIRLYTWRARVRETRKQRGDELLLLS